MSEQAKTALSSEDHGRGAPCYPLRKWWRSSRLFNQDVGLLPFLELGERRRMDMDRLQWSLAACSWPGYIPAPLFVPYITESMHHPSQKIRKEQHKWGVSLDVGHFFPSEISLSVKDGFLEVGGKHEERPDEHGFIARCFARKYRLPTEIDATKIVSWLSVDGILSVEAPVPESSVPAAIIIPIKVEMEGTGEEEEKHEKQNPPESCRAPEAPGVPPAAVPYHGESPPELHGDQAHSDSATAGLQQHEERREQEEDTHEESHPEETSQDSAKNHEALDASVELEHREPPVDGEVWGKTGSDGAAEENPHPEDPEPGKSPRSEDQSQATEAADVNP